MNAIQHFLYDYLISVGVDDIWAKYLNMAALLLAVLILILLIDFVIRKILRRISIRFAERSKTNFDDILITN